LQVNEQIQALLFGPGLPANGEPVHCHVQLNAMIISSGGQLSPQRIRLEEVKALVGGFEHDQLQLTWGQDAEAFTLIPVSSDEQARLVAALPSDVVTGLKRWKKATTSQSFVWKSIVYGIGVIAVAVLIGAWNYDKLVGWVAAQVSLETEVGIGKSVLKSLNPEANFLDKGPAVEAVQRIGNQLTAGSRYKYQWFVAKDNEVNAFAIPGGIIVVNSGLLKKAESANELAAVLAHEVQHVEQKHALKNMLTSAGLASVVLVVLGDASTVMMIIAHQVSAQYFNRQVESDADLRGVELLHKMKINAEGMITFFKKMAQEYKGQSEMPDWFSSHPDMLSRIKTTEDFIGKRPCQGCVDLSWDRQTIMADLKQIKAGRD
jgi:Zn-dependent protease with chaperone function